ncbi:hypothetical protein MMC22_004562 [Lobaria immixta]|nr:hypothetical protein [Lobaria immixta]
MVLINPGFILFPLYIYPTQNAWTPLFTAANTYPNLTFLAVINPDNGPGPSVCPDASYTAAIHTLNSYPNIVTLGYVHTAARYDCGASGTDICPATRTQADLQAEINQYENWSSSSAGGCSTSSSSSIQVNGIFFDESPTVAADVTYMQTISAYVRGKLTHGTKILNNAGVAVDEGYWNYADYINVFENTEAAYRTTDIDALVGDHADQATLIIHTYQSNLQTEEDDVDTIIDTGIVGVFISERTVAQNPYNAFPANWAQLCEYVDAAN